MIASSHRTLANALDALIGADGSLPLRLGRAALVLATLEPDDFADHRLRRKFRELRDGVVMMGLLDGDPADLDGGAAMMLAIRLLDLVSAAARQAVDDE